MPKEENLKKIMFAYEKYIRALEEYKQTTKGYCNDLISEARMRVNEKLEKEKSEGKANDT